MIILTIRTDKPEAEVGLYQEDAQLAYDTWTAHRELSETIHKRIANVLQSQNKELKDIGGLIIYAGPGSFTGLRIGVSLANALAYSLRIPIVGTNGDDWIITGYRLLSSPKIIRDQYVLPIYGTPARTTEPKR